MDKRRTRSWVVAVVAIGTISGGVAATLTASAGSAGTSVVSSGPLEAFAAGAGRDISGNAKMVRNASGDTIVSLHVRGLTAGARYASHVHAASCTIGEANGHYKHDPAGPATPPNEIWPGDGPFTANAAGNANVNTKADFLAGATAVSVVVHDLSLPSTANKVACADLT